MNLYKIGDEVSVTVKNFSKLGAFVELKDGSKGLIYSDDIYSNLIVGQSVKAFVKAVREDGKIDLVLRKGGYKNYIEESTAKILAELNKSNGFLPLNDNSAPIKIQQRLQMSKSQFKKSIGKLYKDKIILISDSGIKLVEN